MKTRFLTSLDLNGELLRISVNERSGASRISVNKTDRHFHNCKDVSK
jgi:hypothetical protein